MGTKAYVAATSYFYQHPDFCVDPEKPDRSRIVSEEYYKTEPPALNEKSCALSSAKQAEWGQPVNPYSTVSSTTLAKETATSGLETERKARINGEFTRAADAVRMLR